MATFDTTRTLYGSANAQSRLPAFINAVVSAVVAWNDARATRKALYSLTDRELDDIGLSRADISAVAENRKTR